MSKKPRDNSPFEGFEQANTTPVPDVLFDEILADLSGPELKVLLYIIRRTKGFKKETDAISLTQFEKGIITGGGKQLDRGCGLNRETICKALASLEKNGYIKSEKQLDEYGRKGTTVYSIRFKSSVVGKTDRIVGKTDYQEDKIGSRQNRPYSRNQRDLVVGKTDIQETVLQQTERKRESTPTTAKPETDSPSHSSTPSSSLIANEPTKNVESKATRNTSNTPNVRNTEPLSPPSLSPEGQRIGGYLKTLRFPYPRTQENFDYLAVVAEYIQSFEQMDSYLDFTRGQFNGGIFLGNLANLNNMSLWLQTQTPRKQPDKKPRSTVDPLAKYKAIGSQFINQGVN